MTPTTKPIAVDSLDPRERNPNRMSASAFAMLTEAIRRHGFLQPLLVREHGERFEIVDGTHRWRAAREVGLDAVPCVVLGEDDNADDVAAALQIGMNRLRGELDLTEVGEALAELVANGWGSEELVVTGFDSSEIDTLIESVKGDDTKSLLAGGDVELPDEDEEHEEAPATFVLEIEFSNEADLHLAKRVLRKAGSGDMGRGLLALLGEAS